MILHEEADVLIVGGGFAGALMALVTQRIGLRPVLIEKGRHPRFAIGESSTPIANLVLENLARTYDLPRLLPLCKYGRWQAHYPQIPSGLKRGFTFMRHEAGQHFQPRADHANELLVAASPRDEIGDTHWFREGFDSFLIQEVRAAGIAYYDQTEILQLTSDNGWKLKGARHGHDIHVSAAFVIDATGPGGILTQTLDLPQDSLRTNSWSVFSHFADVNWWGDEIVSRGGSLTDHPYACDHAALHHVLDEGWVWVLRFNNGVTSAGVMFDGTRRRPPAELQPEKEWTELLDRYPSLGRQFAGAWPVQKWHQTGRIQRKTRKAASENWALLPHTAYFIDPLFSSGNAHSLLAIERLGRILARHWDKPGFSIELANYEAALFREIDFIDRLVHGCYQSFRHFDLLASFTMYYFAGAIYSEERRMKGLAQEDDEFLYSHCPEFRAAFEKGYEHLLETVANYNSESASAFERQVARDIAPFNTGGLCDPAKQGMYPYG